MSSYSTDLKPQEESIHRPTESLLLTIPKSCSGYKWMWLTYQWTGLEWIIPLFLALQYDLEVTMWSLGITQALKYKVSLLGRVASFAMLCRSGCAHVYVPLRLAAWLSHQQDRSPGSGGFL